MAQRILQNNQANVTLPTYHSLHQISVKEFYFERVTEIEILKVIDTLKLKVSSGTDEIFR